MEPDAVASEIARKAGVDPSLLYRWREQLAALRDVPSFVPVTVTPLAQDCAPSTADLRSIDPT